MIVFSAHDPPPIDPTGNSVRHSCAVAIYQVGEAFLLPVAVAVFLPVCVEFTNTCGIKVLVLTQSCKSRPAYALNCSARRLQALEYSCVPGNEGGQGKRILETA